MPKILATLVFLLLFLIVPANNVHAACGTWTIIEPASIPVTYNGKIKIQSNGTGECLPSAKLMAVAYPVETGLKGSFTTGIRLPIPGLAIYRPPSTRQVEQINSHTLEVSINFDSPDIHQPGDSIFHLKGKDFANKKWNISFCSAPSENINIKDCEEPGRSIGTASLTMGQVTSTASTPPSNDLPIINRNIQVQCGYQIGKDIEITVSQVAPNLSYDLFWSGTKKSISTFKVPPPQIPVEGSTTIYDSSFIAKVNGSLTTELAGIRKLCVDMSQTGAGARVTSGGLFREGQNCINLSFFPTPPTDTQKLCSYQDAPPACIPGSPGCPTSAGVRCNSTSGVPVKADDVSGDGILTAIGCVPTEPKALIQGLLKVSSVAGGGIALLLMIAGSFQMITSAGDQHKLQAGREQFSNAIIGLLFIIFSVLLLRIIGVDILALEGFAK